jgi:hypothetical protein
MGIKNVFSSVQSWWLSEQLTAGAGSLKRVTVRRYKISLAKMLVYRRW